MALVKRIGRGFYTLHVWRAVNSKLAGLFQYIHLIFGSNIYSTDQPSEEAVDVAEKIFKLLKAREEKIPGSESSELSEVQEEAEFAIQNCTDLTSLLLVVNDSGYNIVQAAVLNLDQQVLSMLIEEGVSLNEGKCSYPLHLACKMGDLHMVQFLLEAGAQPHLETGMCYPEEHIPVQHVPSRFHFLETDIYTCDASQLLPIMYAIQDDNVEIVQCLLTYSDSSWPSHRYPLHYACHKGAYKTMKFLVQLKPEELNKPDDDGMTPLLHAVQWGRKFVQFLVESGADVHCVTYKQQTALHILYKNLQHPDDLFTTTKFLLGSGLEQDINRKDHVNNTALHMLMGQVNRMVSSYPHNPSSKSRLPQATYDQHVMDTTKLLLQHNCDSNVYNCSGVTALHKLLLMVDFEVSNDPTGITLDTLPARELYKVDFAVLWQVLSVMFQGGAQPGDQTSAGRTCLMVLLQTMLNIDPYLLVSNDNDLLRCVTVLCEAGAKPSAKLSEHRIVVATLAKMGHRCLIQRDPILQHNLSCFLVRLLSLLLQCGLDCNYKSPVRKSGSEGGSGNILVELVKLVQHVRRPNDIQYIHGWVLILLQYGANPDIEPYPSEPIICHSQSSIFLKSKGSQPVNQYMYEIQDLSQIFDGGHAEDLLMLFYNSMDHEALYQCIGSTRFISRFDPGDRIPSSSFMDMLNNIASQPRSLKQNARVAIYKAINRQLNLRTECLPLPRAMKEYLLNVE